VVEERDLERVSNAKQPLDLMINSSVVTGALGLGMALVGLVWPPAPGEASAWLLEGGLVSILWALAYGFYALSIPRAVAWGETVKAVFDLYRWQLLDRLRIDGRPESMDEERALWLRVGGHMLFGRMTTYRPLEYCKVQPVAPESEQAPIDPERH